MTTRFNNIFNKAKVWLFGTIVAAVVAGIAVLLGEYLKDKLWTLLIVDALFYLCLWGFLKNIRQLLDGYDKAINVVIFIIAMALLLLVLSVATIGLLNILWVRLHIVLFFSGAIAMLYFSMKKSTFLTNRV